jgi:hypothetical protein
MILLLLRSAASTPAQTAGTTDGSSAATGNLRVSVRLQAPAAGTSTLTGSLTVVTFSVVVPRIELPTFARGAIRTTAVGGTVRFTGIDARRRTTALDADARFTGARQSRTTTDITVFTFIGLTAGTGTTVAAAINVAHTLQGTTAGTATTTAIGRAAYALQGTTAGTATATGLLVVYGLVFTDTFTDVDATALTAHTSDSGSTWTLAPGYSSPGLQIVGNALRPSADNVVAAARANTPATSDAFEIRWTLKIGPNAASNHGGVMARWRMSPSATNTGISARHIQNAWHLLRYVDGAATELVTPVTATYTQGTTVASRLVCRVIGTEQVYDLYVTPAGGSESKIISVTDSIVSLSRYFGPRAISSPLNASGYEVQDLYAYDIPVEVPDPPDAPVGAGATAGQRSATVSFIPPAYNGGGTIDYYRATASPGGRVGYASPGATSILVGGLTPGTAYTLTVAAHNASQAGYGPESSPSNAVTPTAFAGVFADTFTDRDLVSLTTHLADTGPGWALPPGYGSPGLQIVAGAIRPTFGNVVAAARALAPATSDAFEVRWQMVIGRNAANNHGGVMARWPVSPTEANTGVSARHIQGEWHLVRYNAGAPTELATAVTAAYDAGTVVDCRLECRIFEPSQWYTLYVATGGGTETKIFDVSDSTLERSRYFGPRMISDPTPAGGYEIRDLRVYDMVVQTPAGTVPVFDGSQFTTAGALAPYTHKAGSTSVDTASYSTWPLTPTTTDHYAADVPDPSGITSERWIELASLNSQATATSDGLNTVRTSIYAQAAVGTWQEGWIFWVVTQHYFDDNFPNLNQVNPGGSFSSGWFTLASFAPRGLLNSSTVGHSLRWLNSRNEFTWLNEPAGDGYIWRGVPATRGVRHVIAKRVLLSRSDTGWMEIYYGRRAAPALGLAAQPLTIQTLSATGLSGPVVLANSNTRRVDFETLNPSVINPYPGPSWAVLNYHSQFPPQAQTKIQHRQIVYRGETTSVEAIDPALIDG